VLATISACNIRDFSIFLREPEMLLFAYRDITARISRPTPLKWPETPSLVMVGFYDPCQKRVGRQASAALR
jgi:L-rhamnose mutarotase